MSPDARFVVRNIDQARTDVPALATFMVAQRAPLESSGSEKKASPLGRAANFLSSIRV